MKKINILLLTIVLFSCANQNSNDFENKSLKIIGVENYRNIFTNLKDTFDLWILNSLVSVNAEKIYSYNLDSLLCFNEEKNRLVSCRHLYVNIDGATSDDLQFVYGEKINDKWYFFKGASIVIPRSMIKDHPLNKPLSYQQLHQIALKEIYSCYLKSNGEINDAWFTNHFENVGWCGKCKTTEDFQKSRLEDVKTLWLQRDTTQPIKQLPIKNNNLP